MTYVQHKEHSTGRDDAAGSDTAQTRSKKRIGLFGYFGVGNYGNDWTLEATVDFFRRYAPGEELICFCPDPEAVSAALGIKTATIAHGSRPSDEGATVRRIKKLFGKAIAPLHAFWQLRKVKMLMLPGGAGLLDFQAHPLGWPYDFMVWAVMARLMGRKVVYAGVGAGPIFHPLSRIFLKPAGWAAHYRSYREESTKQFMADFGFDVSQDRVYPDLVFRMPTPPSRIPEEGPLTVCIGLMSYFDRWTVAHSDRGLEKYQHYHTQMVSYVSWLLDKGYRVRLFVGDGSDRRAVEDLIEAVRRTHPDCEKGSLIYEREESLQGVLEQLSDASLVVATRFHSLVCALKMHKPTISITYHPKMDDLMARAGVGEYRQPIEDIDVEVLKAFTEKLIADRVSVQARIGKACERFENELHGLENTILSMIPDRVDDTMVPTNGKTE